MPRYVVVRYRGEWRPIVEGCCWYKVTRAVLKECLVVPHSICGGDGISPGLCSVKGH